MTNPSGFNVTRYNCSGNRLLGGLPECMADRPALKVEEFFESILPLRSRGQTDNFPHRTRFEQGFESNGRDMVAFVDDH